MANALLGCWLKLDGAEKRIEELQAEISSFLNPKPYTVVREMDLEKGDWVHRIVTKQTPEEWGVVIGEAIHDARSALDHLASQLAIANNKDPERCRTAFPIASTPGEFHSRTYDREIGAIDRRHWARIDSVQPCQTQDVWGMQLTALHAMWNADKHRLFHTTAITHSDGYDNLSIPGPIRTTNRAPYFPTIEGPIDGAIVARVPIGPPENAEVQVEADIPVQVTLDEAPPTLKAVEVIELLGVLMEAAAQVVIRFIGAEPQFGHPPRFGGPRR